MNHGPLEAHIVVRRDNGFALDVSLEIAPGTTLALLGPNGAGKSTTVDVLAGHLALDAGHITLAGRVLADGSTFVPPEHRGIGIVFQDYLLFEHMSVRENVSFGAKGASREAAATAWLDRLGIAALADRRPSELSGGQAQRVAVARALATEPQLLLLDEPLAALDIETRTQLRRTLSDHLNSYEGPRLLITHDPTDAFLLADRIAILEDGRITQVGTPDELRSRPATSYAAALAGLNLLSGHNDAGALTLTDYDKTLTAADTQTRGSVLATIRPNAIALHAEKPSGSPRNTWQTTITSIEPFGDITRVMLSDPLPLSVDITPGAATSMSLDAGSPVWASVKATEIHLSASQE